MKRDIGEAVLRITRKIGLDDQEIALRKKFLRLDDSDTPLITAIHDHLESSRVPFAAAFYEHLLSFPQLRDLLPDEATVARLKATQAKYFSELTVGDYGQDYVTERLRVGVVHHRIGLEPKWYMGAYCLYLSGLLPLIWERHQGDKEKIIPTMNALVKVVMFDMGLALDTYFQADKEALSQARDYAEKIVRCMPSGLLVVDADFNIITANRAFRRMCHVPHQTVLEKRPLETVLPSGILLAACKTALEQGVHAHGIEISFSHNGKLSHFEANIASTLLGEEPALLIMLQDISSHKLYEEKLSYLATHDALTHLPNRNLMKDRLTQALAHADRGERIVAVLFLDLDRFKNINDSLGHEAGDQLINLAAERLSKSVREGDTVARIGGDEFVLILTNISQEDDVALLANKILENLTAPIMLGGHDFFPSASIGISLYPKDGGDGTALLKHADAAMYLAKEAGGNTFRFFIQEMNTRAISRFTLEASLRRALERNEFTLYYQPQYDAASGRIICAEALIRWITGDGKLIPPNEFIPLSEETGLIIPIGEWVLRSALNKALEWQARGLPSVRIAVNLSARQFRQPRLAETIGELLANSGFDPTRLELEITESTIMESAQQSVATLRALHDKGIQLAVDDFGTGYSSLSYLKQFPISALKIDRSFVSDIPADADDAAIVSAVIALAHNLKLGVVAEGVETEQQVEFLRSRDCDCFQGFYFSKPVPAEEFEQLLLKTP